ncbi:hypothetical protein N0V87_010354 [Didymella glomerata]|uniref:Uncharacterized protein n=1 Tax=Didymella glomerata TaxID=749621 RepID=A0A9W8WPG3_9PLEO|nr:hypothetical protein N0V87_010354 [Didymella glomerata]
MGKRRTINDLVFEALGSSFNRKDFVLCEKEINSYKEKLWSKSSPVDKEKLEDYLDHATLATLKYLEHPTVSARMQNDVKHLKIELRNIKQITGKDVTTTAGQILDVPSLWVEFMNEQLAAVEKFGKDWLNERIKEAETLYASHMNFLKKKLVQLKHDEKKPAAVKDRDNKTNKLMLEVKQKMNAANKAVRDEDAARKVVKDIEDKIDKEPKQAQKIAIRKKEDLEGKKKLLDSAEKVHLEALKAKSLKDREMHILWPQAVQTLIDNAKAVQDQLAAYKLAVAKVKMPKAA